MVQNPKSKTQNRNRIVIAPYGSLGDLHPLLALGLELRERGHEIVICTLEFYREKIDALGFEFFSLRPDIDPDDRQLAKEMMDRKTGTERIIKGLLMANLRPMFEDLMKATEDGDAFISGEIIFAAPSVVEKRGLKWITTSLAPISMLSAFDPSVFPIGQWIRHLRFLGAGFHKIILAIMRASIRRWYLPYKKFRRELGLDPKHDPIFGDKYSNLLHLAMFSKALGKPQPDWHSPTLQSGFCFYDGQEDLGVMPEGLEEFLASGEAPLVFTLGSAAVMDAGNFFEESIKAAKMLGRRAVMVYGVFNEPPEGLDNQRVGFEYAPFSRLFPKAATVIHQGGVGTTSQVLRAGVPHLIMPYSHDQPDNAARCERLGVARIISRDKYSASTAAEELQKIFADPEYQKKAIEASQTVRSELGTKTACDAIELVLK